MNDPGFQENLCKGSPSVNIYIQYKSWALNHFCASETLQKHFLFCKIEKKDKFLDIFYKFLLPLNLCKFCPNHLDLDEFYTVCKNHDYDKNQTVCKDHSTIFSLVALTKKFCKNFFLNFQVKFTPWTWHHSKQWMVQLVFGNFPYISKI